MTDDEKKGSDLYQKEKDLENQESIESLLDSDLEKLIGESNAIKQRGDFPDELFILPLLLFFDLF